MPKVFISYRTADTGPTATHFYRALTQFVSKDQIFLDHERLDGGDQWKAKLEAEVKSSTVMFLLIGKDWLKILDEHSRRRIDKDDDIVRLEIITAKETGSLIVPILVDREDALLSNAFDPASPIASIADLQAMPLRRKDFDSDIQKLVELLRSNGFTLREPEPEKPKHAPPASKLWMLPNRPSPYFTGQTGVLDRVQKLLEKKTVNVTQPASLVGEGGIGKTELALQYSQKFQNDYEQIFWFSGRDRAALQTDLARACVAVFGENDGFQTNVSLLRAVRMRDALQTMPNILVVLDNVDDLDALRDEDQKACDEVNAEVRFIEPLLELDDAHVLVTSRQENLGDFALAVKIDVLDEEDGALFFLKRRFDRHEATTLGDFKPEDRLAALEISRELGGFQLALEQAGTTARGYQQSPAEYLTDFRKRFRDSMLKHGPKTKSRHPALYTTVEQSLELVAKQCSPAAEFVRWCAYLPPDWIPRELFELEGGEVFDSFAGESLNDLVLAAQNQSLVHYDPDKRAFSMHRLIQRVVRDIDSGSEDGNSERYDTLARTACNANPGQKFEHRFAQERLISVWRFLAKRAADPEAAVVCGFLVADFGYRIWGGLDVVDDAERSYRRAEESLARENPWWINIVSVLASVYGALGRHQNALELKEEVLSAQREVLGPRHPSTLMSMNNLAYTYSDLGRHADALLMEEEVLSARREVLRPRHPDTLMSMNNLATTYSALGRHDDALQMKEEVLAARREVLGLRHPDTLRSMHNLAYTYSDLGRHADALLLEEDVLAVRWEVLGPRHPSTLMSMNNLAGTYGDLGRHADALLMKEEVLSAHREVLGPRHPDTLMSMNNLAVTCWALSRFKEAIDLERQAFEGLQQVFGADHPTTKTIQRHLTEMLTARPDLALPGELEALQSTDSN